MVRVIKTIFVERLFMCGTTTGAVYYVGGRKCSTLIGKMPEGSDEMDAQEILACRLDMAHDHALQAAALSIVPIPASVREAGAFGVDTWIQTAIPRLPRLSVEGFLGLGAHRIAVHLAERVGASAPVFDNARALDIYLGTI